MIGIKNGRNGNGEGGREGERDDWEGFGYGGEMGEGRGGGTHLLLALVI